MRNSVVSALIAALVWALLPLLSLGTGGLPAHPGSVSAPPPAQTEGQEPPEDPLPQPVSGFDAGYRLPVLREGRTESMPLDRYLTGVLLSELPASFSDETRKAQAVACRTYALRSCAHPRHEGAAVCTDSVCCQGWRDPDSVSPALLAQAEAAVRATDGLCIRYQGALIGATFFSCSGGRTEDAAAVWGSELPYLRSVESPGEEMAAHFSDELRLPLEDFRARLLELDPEAELSGDPAGWIGDLRETPGGGVDEILLGGRPFRGTQLRKAFQLRSTAFTLRLNTQEAVFTTRGFGHRVGMSQYGAEAMARAGNDYVTILKWYYSGVDILPEAP